MFRNILNGIKNTTGGENENVQSTVSKGKKEQQLNTTSMTENIPAASSSLNLALQFFKGNKTIQNPSHFDFNTWYHPDICHYLLQMINNKAQCLRVVFQDSGYDNNTDTFKDQIQTLIFLANHLNKPAIFISKEPGADNHFVCGLVKANNLLLINPLGMTKHKDVYKTLAKLQKEQIVNHIWLSSMVLQKHEYEEENLVSCGPISIEIALHVLSTFSLDQLTQFWNGLKTNEPTTDQSSQCRYFGVSIESILPESLKRLCTVKTEEGYKQEIGALRQRHGELLDTLPSYHAQQANMAVDVYIKECRESAPSQEVYNALLTKHLPADRIHELPAYSQLIQELSQSENQVQLDKTQQQNPMPLNLLESSLSHFNEHSRENSISRTNTTQQPIVHTEMHTVRHEIKINYEFSHQFTESASIKWHIEDEKVSSQTFLKLNSSVSILNWFDKNVHKMALYKILTYARDAKSYKELSVLDIEYVLMYCPYKGLISLSDKRILTRIAIKIFLNLAKNKIGLKQYGNTIQILIKELKSTDYKILQYAVMTLCYCICNGEEISAEANLLLIEKIRFIINDSRDFKRFTVVFLGLAALSRLGAIFTDAEWNLLQAILQNTTDKKHLSLYPPQQRKVPCLNGNNIVVDRLCTLKDKAKRGVRLTNAELVYSIHHWSRPKGILRVFEPNNIKDQIIVSYIFKYVVMMGQYNFDGKQEILNILIKEALHNSEIKIQDNAIFTIGTLLNNNAITDEEINEFDLALDNIRKYALIALNFYIKNHGKEAISNLGEWTSLLTRIVEDKRNHKSEIQGKARFVLFYLTQDLKSLEIIMLDGEHCIDATAKIKDAAKQGHEVPVIIIERAMTLLAKDYPLPAKINAIQALIYAAQQGQKFNPNILDCIIKYGIENKEKLVSNGAFTVLGYCSEIGSVITESVLKLFLVAVNDDDKKPSVCFALPNILDQAANNDLDQTWCIIYKDISRILVSNELLDIELMSNVLLTLGKAAKKSKLLDEKVLENLSKFLERSEYADLNGKTIVVLGMGTENNVEYKFSDDTLSVMLSIAKQNNEEVRNDIIKLLCNYISKTKHIFSLFILEKVVGLLTERDFAFSVSEIFKCIVKNNNSVPPHIIEKLTDNIVNDNIEVKINITTIIDKLADSDNRLFTKKTVSNLLNLIDDFDEEVVKNTLSVVKKIIFTDESLINHFTQEACSKLSLTAKDYHYRTSIRIDAIFLLHVFSRKGKKLSIETLVRVSLLLKNEDKEIIPLVLNVILSQINYYSIAIYNNNVEIYNILNIVEQYLKDLRYLKEALLILTEAVNRQYQISNNSIAILINILTIYEDEDVRKHAYQILIKLKECQSPEVAHILALEKASEVLDNESIDINIHDVQLNYLCSEAKNYVRLTVNNIGSLERLLAKRSSILTKKAIYLCYLVAINKQKLSANLMFNLKKHFADDPYHMKDALYAIVTTIVNGDFIENAIFSVFEVSLESTISLSIEYFQALELAIKNNEIISEKSIDRLTDMLFNYDDNLEIIKIILKILLYISSKYQKNIVITSRHITLLLEKNNTDITSVLCSIITVQLSRNQIVSNDLINNTFISSIKSCSDHIEENKIFNTFTSLSGTHDISPDIANFININRNELVFISDDNDVENKIKSLETLLIQPFSQRVLEYLNKILLNHSTSILDKKRMLNILAVAKNSTIPNELMTTLISLLDQTPFGFQQTVKNIILSLIVKKTVLPINIIEVLQNYILTSPNETTRTAAFTLLKKYLQVNEEDSALVLPKKLRVLLELEISTKEKNIKEAVGKILKCELPLSFGNTLFLCNLLENNLPELLEDIIDIFYKEKNNIFYLLQEVVIVNLTNILNFANSNTQKIVEICIAIVNDNKFHAALADKISRFIQDKIVYNKFNISHLYLLNAVLLKKHFTLNECTLKILINTVINNEDNESQRIILNIISNNIISITNLAPSTIRELNKLIALLCKHIDWKCGIVSSQTNTLFNIEKNTFKTYFIDVKYEPYELLENINSCHIESIQLVCKILVYIYINDHNLVFKVDNFHEILKLTLLALYPDNGSYVINKISSQNINQQIYILLIILGYKIDLQIFMLNNVLDNDWICNILCSNLIKLALNTDNDPLVEFSKQKFIVYFNKLINQMNLNNSSSISDINLLLLLTNKHVNESLNLRELNELLLILKSHQLRFHTINSNSNHKSSSSEQLFILTRDVLVNSTNELFTLVINEKLAQTKLNWLKVILFKYKFPKFLDNSALELLQDKFSHLGWDIELIDKFFEKVNVIHTFNDITAFFDRLIKYSIKAEYFIDMMRDENFFGDSLNDWNITLAQHIVCINLSKIVNDKIAKSYDKPKMLIEKKFPILLHRIKALIANGWILEDTDFIFDTLKNETLVKWHDSFSVLLTSLDIAFCYHIEQTLFNSLYKEDPRSLIKKLNHYIINKHLQKPSPGRNLGSLVKKLIKNDSNHGAYNVSNHFLNDDITAIINSAYRYYSQSVDLPSGLRHKNKLSVNNWDLTCVEEWSIYIKHNKWNDVLLPELLSVIMRVCVITLIQKPRDTQLLAALLLYFKDPDSGRFLSAFTGEGKSLMIAIFVVITIFARPEALQNNQVDIITGSSELACRDVRLYKTFYNAFGLQVASNEDEHYTTGIKECYQSEIVYGDSSAFQFDILREMNGLNTKNGRKCSFAIIDEVDNLLIDQSSCIAQLADTMPGMDNLSPLLFSIWAKLEEIDKSFVTKNNKIFYREVKKEAHNNESTIHLSEIGNEEQFICDKIIEHVNFITKEDNAASIAIPVYLKQFVTTQLPKWISSALLAYYQYKEGNEYLIKEDYEHNFAIVPVDYSNTGTLQHGTTWSDGLQQFLQIKHGLKLTPETLLTHYISKIAYFKKYGANLYGLSGTLGSQEVRKLLNFIYKLDFIEIPSYRPKHFFELTGILAKTDEEWLNEILHSAIREAANNRVVLVICEYINDAKELYTQITKIHTKVKLYDESGLGKGHFLDKEVEAGTIVVSTNIAGRGTDIKPNQEAIINGGVNVIITFLPENPRVYLQAKGRAARNGEPGSAQLILSYSQIYNKMLNLGRKAPPFREIAYDFEKIIQEIDTNEKHFLSIVRKYELPKIEFKDTLHTKFHELLSDLKEIDKKQQCPTFVLEDVRFSISNVINNYLITTVSQYKRLAVVERWGLWLKECDFEDSTINFITEFNQFKKNILEEYVKDTVIKNPYYYILIGNELIARSNSLKEKVFYRYLCESALKAYQKAIDIDKVYSYVAIYNYAYAIIRLTDADYKNIVKEDLYNLKNLLIDRIFPLQHFMQQLTQNKNVKKDLTYKHVLTSQIIGKMSVLKILIESTDHLISDIEKSQKLMDIEVRTKNNIITYQKLTNEEAIDILGKSDKESIIGIHFHDLKMSYDLCTRFQSINSLKKRPASSEVSIIFSSDYISNKQSSIIVNLLPIRREKILINKNKKSAERAVKSAIDKPVGLIEHYDFYRNVLKQKLSTNITKAYQLASTPLNKLQVEATDWWNDFKTTENICVDVIMENLSILETTNILSLIKSKLINKNIIVIKIHKVKIKLILHLKLYDKNNELYFSNTKFIEKPEYFHPIKLDNELSQDATDDYCDLSIKGDDLELMLSKFSKVKECLENDETSSINIPNKVSVSFNNLVQKDAKHILKRASGTISLNFQNISDEHDNINKLIYLTQNEHNNAIFKVDNLSSSSAINLIQAADKGEQDFYIKTKNMDHELLRLNIDRTQIAEFKRNGFLYFYDLHEMNPMPWRSVCLVSSLAIIQITGGLLLVGLTAGLGANIGINMVIEGTADIVRVGSMLYSREFDLNCYLFQKSCNYALSLIMASISIGVSPVTNLADDTLAAKTAISSLNSSTSTAVSSVSNTSAGAIQSSKIISNQAVSIINKQTSTRALQSLGKKVIFNCVEKAINTTTNSVILSTSELVLEYYKPSLIKYINREIKLWFNDQFWIKMTNKLFASDKFLDKTFNQDKLLLKIEKIIDTIEFEFFGYQVLDVRSIETIKLKITQHIRELAQQFPSFSTLLYERLKHVFDQNAIKVICKMLYQQAILTKHGCINISILVKNETVNAVDPLFDGPINIADYGASEINLDKINLGMYDQYKIIILETCRDYYVATNDEYFYERNILSDKLSKAISDRMTASLKLIADKTNQFLEKAAAKLTHGVLRDCVHGIANLHASHQSHSVTSKVASARDHLFQPDIDIDGTYEYDDLEKTNEISLIQLESLSNEINQPIEIYREGTRVFSVNPDSIGTPIKITFTQSPDHPMHWVDLNSIQNNDNADLSLLDIIAENSDHSIDQLKDNLMNDTQLKLACNKVHFCNIHINPTSSVSPSSLVRSANKHGIGIFKASKHVKHVFLGKSYSKNDTTLHDVTRIIDDLLAFNADFSRANTTNWFCMIAEQIESEIIYHYKISKRIQLFKNSYTIQKKLLEMDDKTKELYKSIILHKKRLIKFIIAFILLENKIASKGINFEKIDTDELKKEISEETKIIFSEYKIPKQMQSNNFDKIFKKLEINTILFDKLRLLLNEFFHYKKLRSLPMESFKELAIASNINLNELGQEMFKFAEEGQYSEMGRLLKHGSLNQKGYITGNIIERVGSTVQGLVEAHKISIEARARVQYMIVALAEKTINQQHDLYKEIINIEHQHQELAKFIVARHADISKDITAFENKIIDAILKLINLDGDQSDKIKVLENMTKRFSDNQTKIAKNMTEVSKDHAIDPKFVIKCGEQSASVVRDMLDTVRVLGKQNESQLSELTKNTFDKIKAITGIKGSSTEKLIGERIKTEKTKSLSDSTIQIEEIACEDDKSLPKLLTSSQTTPPNNPPKNEALEGKKLEDKSDYEKAQEAYQNGKKNYKLASTAADGQQAATYHVALNFFRTAQKKYRNVLQNSDQVKFKEIAKEKLEKLGDDGKYSIEHIKPLTLRR